MHKSSAGKLIDRRDSTSNFNNRGSAKNVDRLRLAKVINMSAEKRANTGKQSYKSGSGARKSGGGIGSKERKVKPQKGVKVLQTK